MRRLWALDRCTEACGSTAARAGDGLLPLLQGVVISAAAPATKATKASAMRILRSCI